MESNVFYRKYRPQKLAELDLPQVREGLIRIIKSGKIPPSLLFAGPKGTGKTSAARIIAKTINCLKRGKDTEPCNKCSICKEITAGTAVDLIEIDAASHRGIDDVRALQETIKLSPAKCKYKVYIVDEAHMLTTEAFNALLKTLEEPPSHAVFILCTTEPEKLPETILSRCVRFSFRQAKKEEVLNSLQRVMKGESLEAEEKVLEEITSAAGGSFRDAQKILDQLAGGGKKIFLEQAKEMLGQTQTSSPGKLLGLIVAGDARGALAEIGRLVSGGSDPATLNRRILDALRAAMMALLGMKEIKVLDELQGLSLDQIRLLIDLFSRSAIELKNAPIPELPLELAVVDYIQAAPASPAKQGEPAPLQEEPGSRENEQKINIDLDQVKAKWAQVLVNVKPLNHSVEALLRACRPLKIDGEKLVLEVFYKFHKERLETDKCRKIVEDVINNLFHQPLKVRCILGEKVEAKPLAGEPENDTMLKIAEDIFLNN